MLPFAIGVAIWFRSVLKDFRTRWRFSVIKKLFQWFALIKRILRGTFCTSRIGRVLWFSNSVRNIVTILNNSNAKNMLILLSHRQTFNMLSNLLLLCLSLNHSINIKYTNYEACFPLAREYSKNVCHLSNHHPPCYRNGKVLIGHLLPRVPLQCAVHHTMTNQVTQLLIISYSQNTAIFNFAPIERVYWSRVQNKNY